MPNWVFNTLTIEGNPTEVFKLKEQVSQPFTTFTHEMTDNGMKAVDYTYDEPIFAFWNIIAPTDLVAYKSDGLKTDVPVSDPNWWAEQQKVAAVDNSWYAWNNRNWGVKWDVAKSKDGYKDTELIYEAPNGENQVLVYRFDTPWGIADEALLELSRQYPTLLFTLEYEEETGWGGEREYLRGTVSADVQWEEKCVDCGALDCVEYCEECGTSYCLECEWSNDEVECTEDHSGAIKAGV